MTRGQPLATRKHFDVDSGDGSFWKAQDVETGIAQFQTELVFRLCVETTMALAAGRMRGPLHLLVNVDFWMNFKLDHDLPQERKGHERCQNGERWALKANNLPDQIENSLSHITQ